MEKCSFCIQRINRTSRKAKSEGRELEDGEIQTACSAACGTHGIVFGDLNDPNSRVSKLKNNKRAFTLLEQFGTDPNVIYLAKVDPHKKGSEEGHH